MNTEMNKYQQYARTNYIINTEVDEFWHPEIQAECKVMNDEAELERQALERETKARIAEEKARIKQVVASVEDLEEEMKGKIVIFTEFKGTLTETQALNGIEKDLVKTDLDSDVKKRVGMSKPLFGDFPTYDRLKNKRIEWREKVKQFGIPFFGKGMTVIDIKSIPAVEALFDEIDTEMPVLARSVADEYPSVITQEAVKTGPLHNPRDYRNVSEIQGMFTLTRKWMPAFDVPDILKEVDMVRWEQERQRSAALWAEVRENGARMLREQVASMATRLVDSMENKEDGTKKKFFATTITQMDDFFATFENRNMSGDKDLAAEVQKLKDLIANRKTEDFKTDDALRAKVKAEGSKVLEKLNTMLVSASSRSISFEE